eukprot:6491431-Amphidinium_carterae.2
MAGAKMKAKAAAKSAAKAVSKAEPKAASRHLCRRDTDAQVARVLSEHFADLTNEEKEVRVVEGKTLRQTLVQAKRDKKLANGRLTNSLRSSLKRKFMSNATLSAQLEAADKNQPIQQGLVDAFQVVYHKNPTKRSKTPLTSFLSQQPSLNNREAIAILKSICECNLTHPSERKHVITVLGHFAKTGLKEVYKKELLLLEHFFDRVRLSTHGQP